MDHFVVVVVVGTEQVPCIIIKYVKRPMRLYYITHAVWCVVAAAAAFVCVCVLFGWVGGGVAFGWFVLFCWGGQLFVDLQIKMVFGGQQHMEQAMV